MLKIRLARVGKKKKPTYRFIVSESAKDPFGVALEILGHYNPFSKVCEVKKDRILYWVSKGAQVSPTVHNILIDQNVLSGQKVKASKGKKKGEPQAPVAAEAPKESAAPVEPALAAEVKSEEKPAE
ncbi:MAG: 30S ribosomal protein S16 [Patescibacteria group bacterium]